MGIVVSRPPETATMGAPFLRTPFTDMTSPIGNYDDGPCLPFEIRWIDCLEAYGPLQGKEKCKLLFQDFNECAGCWKQMKRVSDMKEERNNQWVRGLLGNGPRVNLYEESPKHDSYAPEMINEVGN